jgi:hypothetical protein
MQVQHVNSRRALLFLFALSFAIGTSGCTVKLVADYDETTDKAVTALQMNVEAFLVNLERNFGTPEAAYEHHTEFYDQTKVQLSAIRTRAAARPKNEETVQQLDLLASSLASLEDLHELGFEDVAEFEPLRNAFQTSFTAILALELAKKRGD